MGLVSGSGSFDVFAVLGRSVEHAADPHGKPFTIIKLGQEIHPRVGPALSRMDSSTPRCPPRGDGAYPHGTPKFIGGWYYLCAD